MLRIKGINTLAASPITCQYQANIVQDHQTQVDLAIETQSIRSGADRFWQHDHRIPHVSRSPYAGSEVAIYISMGFRVDILISVLVTVSSV